MLNLILKDILMQKKMFFFGLGYGLFVLVVFQNAVFEAGAYIMGAVAIAYMFILGACAYEDKNKSENILFSLPLKRSLIVVSKYLSVLVFTMISLALLGLIGALMKGSGLPVPHRYLGPTDILATMVSLAILVSLYLPFYFRWGYIKSRLFNLVLFLLVFFSPNMLIEYVKNTTGTTPSSLGETMEALSMLPGWMSGLGLSGLVLILLILSLLLSINFYNRREL